MLGFFHICVCVEIYRRLGCEGTSVVLSEEVDERRRKKAVQVTPLCDQTPFRITPNFSPISCSITTKVCLQYLVPCVSIFHNFFLVEIIVCGEIKKTACRSDLVT
jgi:hypothetical protein